MSPGERCEPWGEDSSPAHLTPDAFAPLPDSRAALSQDTTAKPTAEIAYRPLG